MRDKYVSQEIESKWQGRWERDELYKTEPAGDKPKYYILDFYPYPSGEGMSVGHARNYVPTDVVARYYRMKGYNVLHPMGFDAFGLPTENAAIKQKINPHILNERYSANYVRQYKLMGLSYDWSRLFNSSHPSYYRWTQWIFLQLFGSWYDVWQNKARPIAELEAELERNGTARILDFIDANPEQVGAIAKSTPRISAGEWKAMGAAEKNAFLMDFRLAFRKDSAVNWDPVDKVVVANEEVDAQGRAWRSGAVVMKKSLRQWFFRITAYANRLAADLDTVDWPDRIVIMQRNWIGKSYGAEVEFKIEGEASSPPIVVYTTRPDTLWGATFMVLAPEHPLVNAITADGRHAEVRQYVEAARNKSDIDRSQTKTGVFTGAHAINPVNGERIPIWVADYVLMSYGTGAIMAVPAHDQRDFEFARKYDLPIVQVVKSPTDDGRPTSAWSEAYEDKAGVIVSSGVITGTEAGQPSIDAACDVVEELRVGKRRVNFKIRDWLTSRQRYWGTPIPILHTDVGEVTVPESELPVLLPDVESYEPTDTGESPLAVIQDWVNTPNGKRETDTMPTWACSSWYFLRFSDPHNDRAAFTPSELKYWMPVDMYVGGAEHAVLHLLYARMWNKVLFDLGHVPTIEPFQSLRNQGMILSPQKKLDERGREYFEKMSKSKGNVITPDEVIADWGADALRGYEMFISDFEATVPWNTQGVPGVRRWLDRVWRIVLDQVDDAPGPASKGAAAMTARELRRVAHQTIIKFERDVRAFSFNTIVSSLMEFTNALYKARESGLSGAPEWNESIDILLKLIAPVAPHIAEELWERLGREYSIHKTAFPVADEAAAREDEVVIVVQVNGKVRDRITLPAGSDDASVRSAALASEGARKFMDGRAPKDVRVVPGRLVNIVL